MFGFKRGNTGPVYGALIDIGSGSIGVAIVVSEKDAKRPKIIYAERMHMRISEHSASGDEAERRIREALLSASLSLSQEGNQSLTAYDAKAKIRQLYVTCTSPWSRTMSRSVHYESESPFKITQKLLDDLVQSAEAEIFSHLKNDSLIEYHAFEVVERATVDILVNDYRITDPLNMSGVSLSLSHIAGLVPKEILKTVYEIQDKLFPHSELHTHTYMLAAYCVLRDLFPKIHSSCVIDITAEAVEFGIIENNLLIDNSFIPYGSSTMTRDIISKTNQPSADVLTRIRAFGEEGDTLSTDLKGHVEEYIQHIQVGLEAIIEHRVLPSDIIITTHQSYKKLFRYIVEEALRRVKPSSSRLITVDQEILERIAEGGEGDVYLVLGAGFFHKLHTETGTKTN